MKSRNPIVNLLCLGVLMFAVAAIAQAPGCKADLSTPVAQVTLATDTYTATLRSLSTFRRAGMISDDEYRSIEVYRKAAATALNQATAAVDQPGDQWLVYIRAFNAAVDELVKINAQVQGRQ